MALSLSFPRRQFTLPDLSLSRECPQCFCLLSTIRYSLQGTAFAGPDGPKLTSSLTGDPSLPKLAGSE